MNVTMLVADIATLHHDSIPKWKKNDIQLTYEHFLRIVEENHAFNYQLWHAEDRARRDDMGFEFVYQAKREIDHYNQQRNNCMEEMDLWLFVQLQPAQPEVCPVNSETPGMMIDRLSIMALKIYHMQLQTKREEVTDTHRQTCLNKLQILHAQQEQLQQCLQHLLQEIKTQQRTFRLYQQFKMYNDPSLNPELYQEK